MASFSPAELDARLRLHALPELGAVRQRLLLDAFWQRQRRPQCPGLRLARPAPAGGGRGGPPQSRHRERVDQALAWLDGPERHLLCLGDERYPALLAEIADPPPLLFVEGRVGLLERPQLALVGSRQASAQGLDNARRFAHSLAAAGFCITSGLALGINGSAHQGALEAGGGTVAVLGTGLRQLYPRRHLGLARRLLAEGGALVSELPLDCTPQAANFPRRNRIISGLSLGTLVVEASPSSGSLITARLAAEQGREVFALPGSIHHPGARGCHQLIREGAQLVEGVEHILEALQGWRSLAPLATTAAVEEPPLLRQLAAGPLNSEELARLCGLSLPEVLVQLTELELEGRIVAQQGSWCRLG